MKLSTGSAALCARARHETANLPVAEPVIIGPHNGRAETVGLSYNGVVRHNEPLSIDSHTNSPLKPWFDRLASGKGLCCSFADGFSVQDVDWGHPGWALSANRPSSRATSWSGTSIVVNKTHGLPD